MKFTSAEYINKVKFKHFRTYSFQRKGDYDLLNNLTEKIRSGNEFNPEEKSIYENLKAERNNLYTNRILNESNALNRTAELVAIVSDESEYYSTLIKILQTEIEEEMLWLCAPIYRDAILFYDSDNKLINGINICFECDRIESIKGEHVATDFKTFKYLKQLLLQMGHQIEDPDTFRADELLKIIEQNKKNTKSITMPVLQITRSSEYANRIRNIKLFLDGTLLGTIKNGETKDFEIAAGTHMLQAKIDWCSSNKISFVVVGNEAKNFNLTSFAKHNPLGSLAAIYYITFGAGKYLNLKEVS